MRVELEPIKAFEHVLKLSLQLETILENQSQTAESEKISHIFIRSLDSDANSFVTTEQSTMVWRVLDSVSFLYTRKVVPYNLEGNIDYLHLLFDKLKGASDSLVLEQFPRDMRHRLRLYFGGNCRAALSSLISRVEMIISKHNLDVTRKEALQQKVAAIRQVFGSIKNLPRIVHGHVVSGQEGQELQKQLKEIRCITDYDFFCSEIKSAEDRLSKVRDALSTEEAFSICYDIVNLKFERRLARLAEPIVLRRSIMFKDRSPLQENVQNIIDDYEDTYDEIVAGIRYLKTYSTTGDIAQIDKLACALKEKLLDMAQDQLHKVFAEIGGDLTSKITRTESLIDFHAVHEEVRKNICDLIELDESIQDEALYRLFHANIEQLGEQFQKARLPRQTEILNKEVHPQVQALLLQACSTTDVEKISNLQREVASYNIFLQKTQNQLKDASDTTSTASLEVLERIIRVLQDADSALQKRLDELAKGNPSSMASVTQTVTGDGVRVVIANSPNAVVTIGGRGTGSGGGDDDSFFSQFIKDLLPTGGIANNVLSYGPQVFLSAATIYFTGNVSLTTSILSGMALTAAPAVVSSAANVVSRQVLPQPLVPLMAPVVDFAMRLLVLRYGPRVVQLIAGSASIPAASSPQNGAVAASPVIRPANEASSSSSPSAIVAAEPIVSISSPAADLEAAPKITPGDVLLAAGASVALPIAKVALNRIGASKVASEGHSLSQPAKAIRVQNMAQSIPEDSYSASDDQNSSQRSYFDITGTALKIMSYASALFLLRKQNQSIV